MEKINGIDCGGRFLDGEALRLSLSGCTLAEAAALDGQDLTVTDAEGAEVCVYKGYAVARAELSPDGGDVRVRLIRKLSEASQGAIEALEENVRIVSGKAKSAGEKAEAAMEAAEQAGASPSIKAASSMYVNAVALTSSQIADVRDLIEDFVPGEKYGKGLVRRYEGKYYRMDKDIDATTSTTYQPGTGTESLYTLIDLAPDGIRVWHMPTCAEDSFALGEKAHYPDADGPVYVSGRVGNVSEPGQDKWWTLEGGE